MDGYINQDIKMNSAICVMVMVTLEININQKLKLLMMVGKRLMKNKI